MHHIMQGTLMLCVNMVESHELYSKRSQDCPAILLNKRHYLNEKGCPIIHRVTVRVMDLTCYVMLYLSTPLDTNNHNSNSIDPFEFILNSSICLGPMPV